MKDRIIAVYILASAGALCLSLLAYPTTTHSALLESSLPIIANTLQMGGEANSVAVDGSTAYVGIGTSLNVFNISDPTDPVHLGQSPALPGIVVDIAIADGLAYLAVVYGTLPGGALHILDVSDPLHPVETGRWLSPQGAYSVQISGDAANRRAYLAADGVYILDVSTPAAPVPTGWIPAPTSVSDVITSGGLLYLLRSNHLLIYDLVNPDNPALLGEFESAWQAASLALHGGFAYLADSTWGITIVDVSSPSNPTLAGSYDDPGEALDIAVDGSTAYIADGMGLKLLDVSNPAQPSELGSYDTPARSISLAYANDVVYLADGADELRIVDVSNPEVPSLLNWWFRAGIPYSMHATTEKLVAADSLGRLHIYDASSAALVEIGRFEGIPSTTLNMDITGGKAFLAGDIDSLVILDITNYGSIKLLGRLLYPSGRVFDVSAAGEYAYLANMYDGSSPGGLQVVNVSNPYQPQQVGLVNASAGGYSAIAVRSSLAYIAGDQKLIIYDVSKPSAPVRLGDIDLEYAFDLVVEGDYAYVARQSSGVSIVDVSNPSAPVLVKTVSFSNAYSLATAGDVLYIADRSSGLWAMDISAPLATRSLASYPAPYEMFFVTSDGSRAFSSDFLGGLMVFEMDAIQATDFLYLPLLSR